MIVSIGIIALNEEKYLSDVLGDILAQSFPLSQIDLILIDSMSNDSTRMIMETFKENHLGQFNDVRVFANVRKWLANGWNVFLDNAAGDIVLKVDAHSQIPSDFVEKIVDSIGYGQFDVVGGKRPTILKDSSMWANILIEAENALFGSGFAVFRTSDKARYVKSVFHGAYRKEVFDRVGRFNEQLRRTEDNEIHWRIRKYGYKIWYDPTIVSYQYARPTLLKMLKQKYLNGYWIGKTMWICPMCFSLYHFAPLCFVLSLILFSALSTISYIPLFVLVCLYGLFDLFNTAISIAKNKNLGMIILLGIFPMLHITYGLGTLFGLFAFSNKRK